MSDLDTEAGSVEVNQWQIKHIKYGMRQADAGQFATEDARHGMTTIAKKFRQLPVLELVPRYQAGKALPEA